MRGLFRVDYARGGPGDYPILAHWDHAAVLNSGTMKLRLSRFFILKMGLLVGSMVALTLFSMFSSPEGAEETSDMIVTLGTMVAALFGAGLCGPFTNTKAPSSAKPA